MEAYLKVLSERKERKKQSRLLGFRLVKKALSEARLGRRPHHPFTFDEKAYRFEHRTRVLETNQLNIELEKNSHFVPVLLRKKEVGGVLKGKISLRLDAKTKNYISEKDTPIIIISDEETWMKTRKEWPLLHFGDKTKPRDLQSYIRKLKRRRNLRSAEHIPLGSFWTWIENAGRLGRFGLLLTDQDKLEFLSNSLIRLDTVGLDVEAKNDFTLETYSDANGTVLVEGSFLARNDIHINCGLEAERISFRNDVLVGGDIVAKEQIGIRNDARFLGEVKAKLFAARNDVEVRGLMRAELIKVRNDIKFLSDVYADQFEARNDICIGGDAHIRIFKCSNDCTIRGNLITSQCSMGHDFRVGGQIRQYPSNKDISAIESLEDVGCRPE